MTRDELVAEIASLGGDVMSITNSLGGVTMRFEAGGKVHLYAIRHTGPEGEVYPAFLDWARDDFARGVVKQ